MIRSDYLCKRTITLEYILFVCIFVLRVGFGTTDNCEAGCQQCIYTNTSEDYKYVQHIGSSGNIRFTVKTNHVNSIVYIGLYSDNVTDIEYEMIFDKRKCEIRKRGMTRKENYYIRLNCGENLFRINYDYGMFKLEQGGVLEHVMEYNDTNPSQDIEQVAIKTSSSSSSSSSCSSSSSSSSGNWCFFDTDDGTQTTEETSSTVDNAGTTSPPTAPHLSTQNTDTDKPFILSMTPYYGPRSGGTEVNINGSFLDSRTKLWLGSNFNYELNFTLMPSGNISAVTPRYTGPEPNDRSVPLNVIIQLNNDAKTVPGVKFTYKPDPQVVDIYPRKMTKSGGLTVTVEGSNLDSVAAPLLTVTVLERSDQSLRDKKYSPCTPRTSKQLLCVTPKIPEYISTTKRKRHIADNRRRRRGNDEELDFVLGLQFDGADNYEDLTDNLPHLAHIEVHQNPSFSPGQMFSFDPEFAGAIGIKGENVDAGVVVADYKVNIGKGFCTNIGITSDKLYCNPPLTLDEVTDGNDTSTTRAHNEADITVRVGANLVYTVGYIVYDIEETISLYTIFVPVVAALGALLVVFVIILIVCCCRKARAKKDSDKTLATSAQDLNTLEPSRNDNYYTDETQPKNQYYMVVNQGANGQ